MARDGWCRRFRENNTAKAAKIKVELLQALGTSEGINFTVSIKCRRLLFRGCTSLSQDERREHEYKQEVSCCVRKKGCLQIRERLNGVKLASMFALWLAKYSWIIVYGFISGPSCLDGAFAKAYLPAGVTDNYYMSSAINPHAHLPPTSAPFPSSFLVSSNTFPCSETVFMGQVFIWNPRTCRSLIGVSLVLMAVAPKITKQQMEKCFNFLKRSFNHVWVKLSHHTVSDFFPSYNFFERFPDGLSFSSAERTQENKLFP